jgi:hypothetical protein
LCPPDRGAADAGAGREHEARAIVLRAGVHEGVKTGTHATSELVDSTQVAGKVRELMDGGEAGGGCAPASRMSGGRARTATSERSVDEHSSSSSIRPVRGRVRRTEGFGRGQRRPPAPSGARVAARGSYLTEATKSRRSDLPSSPARISSR